MKKKYRLRSTAILIINTCIIHKFIIKRSSSSHIRNCSVSNNGGVGRERAEGKFHCFFFVNVTSIVLPHINMIIIYVF